MQEKCSPEAHRCQIPQGSMPLDPALAPVALQCSYPDV